MALRPAFFGALPDGREVGVLTLRNAQGIELKVITYGAIIVSLVLPDRSGEFADVVLGHDNIDSYIAHSPYFGAVIGRYANRISGGAFVLDGVMHEVSRNEGLNCLHGGTNGFDRALWKVVSSSDCSVSLTHTGPNGDEGFPGALTVLVTYTLSDADELLIDYEATTTADTVVNLTQHTYWNLSGAGSGHVLDHDLTIAASRITPVDAALIPTGEMRIVEATPFDFRAKRTIGERIHADDDQLRIGHGYDHNFVLDSANGLRSVAARLHDPASGRSLEIRTTEPGIQLYTGNRLDGSIVGKQSRPYARNGGVCLETQHFPDSPNRPEFPSTTLRPGEIFRSQTVYVFSSAGP